MAEKKPNPPSEKKKSKARKDGQVLKSQILTQSFGAALVVFIILGFSSLFFLKLKKVFKLCWVYNSTEMNLCATKGFNLGIFSTVAILFSLVLVSITFEFFQIGFKLEWSILKFKLKNFNIGKGIINLFKKLKDTFLIIIKAAIFLGVVFFILYIYRDKFFNLFSTSKLELTNHLSSLFIDIFSLLSLVIILVGGVDYFFKYRKYYADLSMSEQEVRDEYKEIEGDPHIKAQRQAMHEELMYTEVVKRVKECKVIIVDRNK